jgi:hypothetical protein
MRAEDEEARYQRARDQYYEQVRRQKEIAENGFYFYDRERTLKDAAPDYTARNRADKAQDGADDIGRSQEQNTRPRTDSTNYGRRLSPVRETSTKEKVHVNRRDAGKPSIKYRTNRWAKRLPLKRKATITKMNLEFRKCDARRPYL